MSSVVQPARDWWSETSAAWNRFWFTPAAPHTLALIRILAGAMLLYTHVVWSLDLLAFLGPQSWIPAELSRQLQADSYAWSLHWFIESPGLLWTTHLAALAIFAMLMVGLFTRVVAVLAFLITVSYCYRLQGALFGLDQVNAMLVMYLMVGEAGAAFSVDRWWKRRRQAGQGGAAKNSPPSNRPTSNRQVSTNIAIRLIQLHMCVIYLFGGIGKMRGEMWWDGSALWYSIANLEYQSWDITWLVRWPFLIALLTHLTVLWETFYCALVWHRLTRPLVLAMAVLVHGGIAAFLGMITFGLAMLIGNLAFLPPATLCRWLRVEPE